MKKYPDLAKDADRPEVDAIRQYLKTGGIIKTDDGEKFRIIYPTKKMIDDRITSLRRQRTYYVKEINKLKSLERDFTPIRLAFDPLYIKHQMKMLSNQKYREAFKRLGFSWEHFLDPKTRKIIEQFMDNPDYRARVLQALDESPIYKSRRFGAISEAARNTRREIINKKIQILQRKVDELERQITVLTLLKRWM